MKAPTANVTASSKGRFSVMSQLQVTRNLTNSRINKLGNYLCLEKHTGVPGLFSGFTMLSRPRRVSPQPVGISSSGYRKAAPDVGITSCLVTVSKADAGKGVSFCISLMPSWWELGHKTLPNYRRAWKREHLRS